MRRPDRVRPLRRAVAPTRLGLCFAILDGMTELGVDAETGESWTSRIVSGIRFEAAQYNTELLLLNNEIRSDSLDQIAHHLEQVRDRVDGLITFPFARLEEMFEILDRIGLPTVTINRLGADVAENFVDADYYRGSQLVGQLFARIDAKKVWFVSTQIAGVFSKEQRYGGLVDGLRLAGSSGRVRVVLAPTASEEDGYHTCTARLAEEGMPDAVYCSGDYLAMGAMRALTEAGARIGENVSVLGSSGFAFTALTRPSLSVVQIPMVDMGRRAIRLLKEMIDRGAKRISGVTLPTRLILRDSTPASLLKEGWVDQVRLPHIGVDL